jgi:hypothetical protein
MLELKWPPAQSRLWKNRMSSHIASALKKFETGAVLVLGTIQTAESIKKFPTDHPTVK